MVGYKENKDIDDSDNDDMEFEDADEEEQEDILQSSMRKSSRRTAGAEGGMGGFLNISKVQQNRLLSETQGTIMRKLSNQTSNIRPPSGEDAAGTQLLRLNNDDQDRFGTEFDN